jgi:beta-barrel assembly-enhancing protease
VVSKRLFAGALLALALCGCGVNPVTGERELQFISEAQELKIGEQQYAPTRQSEGGDFKQVPELTTYVNEVGQKLAKVSDRALPYEFVVLNSSVPNAWALPGGKIAVNRGLLTELKNEGELAAVLGHEIVHAAARHGAKAQERGVLLQAGLAAAQIGAAIGGVDQNVAGLVVQGAGLGAALIQTKYGREQELQSDEYGMKYMKAAGYDPNGAVTLQETFVRLSTEGGAKQQSWFEGLFASHPPSADRVEKNKATAAALGAGGDLGQERFAARVQPLLKLKPAYDKYDQSLAAARKKNYTEAKSLATEAVGMLPREARFHQMLGELALNDKQPEEAIPHFQKAIDLDPGYFGSFLGAGVAQYRAGNKSKAEEWLTKSAELLPTAPAAYYLGTIARDRGDTQKALQLFEAAAGSQSEIGKEAAAEFVRLDLPANPAKYIAAGGQLDGQGRVFVVIQNRAPVALTNVQVTPVLVDAAGRVVRQASPVRLGRVLAAGERVVADAGVGALTQEQLAAMRFRVDGARIAE